MSELVPGGASLPQGLRRVCGRRVGNVKEVVKRGQDVWVKVISTSGQRLSLSMRDVDQATGQDLLPMGRPDSNPAGPGARAAPSALHGLSGIKVWHALRGLPLSDCNVVAVRGRLLPISARRVWFCKMPDAESVAAMFNVRQTALGGVVPPLLLFVVSETTCSICR